MNKPLVSIIIVTYNAEKHLDNCLKNIREQHCDNIQVILMDGGSTDSTLDIIRKHEYIIDFWLSEPDRGIYDAMNKAISHIKGKWVLFLGADDLLEVGFKEMLTRLKDPFAIYYGMVDVNKTIYKGEYNDYDLAKLNICHQAIFYSAVVFKKYKYNLEFPIWADWYLNMQCWIDPDFKFIYEDCLISKFGLEGLSSTTTDKVFEQKRRAIIIRHFGLLIWIRLLFREFKHKLYHKKAKKPS